jgi:hypothetical protein
VRPSSTMGTSFDTAASLTQHTEKEYKKRHEGIRGALRNSSMV